MPVSRLFDIPDHQLRNYPQPDALVSKENGKWKPYSTQDLITHANAVSEGLLILGIKKGEKVATISNNRPEWNFVDIGILQIGAVHVPIYPTISESEYRFILNDAEVKLVFVSDEDLFHKIENVRKQVASIQHVFTFNPVQDAKHWTELTLAGTKNQEPDKLNKLKSSIQDTELATLIYTSGTTGNPKGVMLSHRNIVSNFIACEKLPPVDYRHRALSFLPLCHSYERMLTYLYMYLGVSIYYAESIEKIGDNLKETNPHLFTTVPRLLEKVYDKITAKGKELSGLKKALFFWALNLGLRYELDGKNGVLYELQLLLANKIIFNKWREALGGHVVCIVSGGAALQPRLARVFRAAKIPVLEGYGLTETSPVIAVNLLGKGRTRFGTVGKAIPGVEIKIAEDGEILCKGPNIMLGYYKRPDLTAEVIDREGWFHTGDIGVLENQDFLKITDRKKELFKTSGGKYIAPQPMENKFKESLFIEQIMVIGEAKNFAAALIVPAFAFLKSWCKEKEIAWTTNEEMIRNEKILQRFSEEINSFNQEFGKTEQLKKFELLPHEWTVDSGELTPTMKLKRKVILEKYKEVIEKIYSTNENKI